MRHRPPRSVRRARPPKPRSPICSVPGGSSRVSSRLSTRASRRCDSPRSAPSCPRRGIPTSRMRTERIWCRSKRQCIIAPPTQTPGARMRHLAAFLLMLAASGALAYTADELAAKNAAAKGSPDELAALKSVRLPGKLRGRRGTLELRYVALIRRPDSIGYEVQLPGPTRGQPFAGEPAGQTNPFQGRDDPENPAAADAKGLSENAADFNGVLGVYRAQ